MTSIMFMPRVARSTRARRRLQSILLVLGCLLLYLGLSRGWNLHPRLSSWTTQYNPLELGIPREHSLSISEPDETHPSSPMCADRLHAGYLQAFVDSATHNYCDTSSRTSLSCSGHKVHTQTDSFCFISSALLNQKSIDLDCKLRQWGEEDIVNGKPPMLLKYLSQYWYNTGPGNIFRSRFIKFPRNNKLAAVDTSRQRTDMQTTTDTNLQRDSFKILVRREGSGNLWHCMMEIMSMTMTLDILHEKKHPITGLPLFTTQDIENTQVLFLDNHSDGPYFDLWSMYAGQPPARFSTNNTVEHTNLIVPLAGASNPSWQGHWLEYHCGESVLLQTFSGRVLHFYGIEPEPRRGPLVLTFINRRDSRRLINQDEHLQKLELEFPEVQIRVVDFAELTFVEQLRVAQSTDILVGVHGAGLTHGFFLPPGSAVIELRPIRLKLRMYQMMTQSLGHQYHTREGERHLYPDWNGDWQHDDVFMQESDVVDVVGEAINDIMRSRSADLKR